MMADRTTPLLADLMPTPKQLDCSRGSFRLDSRSRIFIPLGASRADRRSADLLAEAVKRHLKIKLRVVETTRYVNQHLLFIGLDERFDLPPHLLPEKTAEGHAIRIDRSGVLLAGHDESGLYYAVRTLEQILRLKRRKGNMLDSMTIRDWPDLSCRGLMMDVARQSERPDYIENYIGRLGSIRKNMFVLYFENRFAWKSHPHAAAEISYTADDFRRFDAAAADNHIDFVPALASLGHCEGMLRSERYRHLRQDGAIYQLTLRDERVRDFLADLYAEILPTYRSRYFHANCDESPLLAGPPGSPKSYMRESLRLFNRHLVFLHDLLARHGKQMMIWGDMLLHHPEIAADLPRDIIIVDWDYGSMVNRRREAPQLLRDMGFPVIVAPAAARSAEVAFPPLMQMAENVPQFIRQAHELKLMGEMTTLWEMYSTNPIVSWPGVVASAQYAWNSTAFEPHEIARRVAAHQHGPSAADAMAKACDHLSGQDFLDRYRQTTAKPELPHCRTYHLDSHEFAPTDPFVYLTYRPSDWATRVSRTAAQGLTDVLRAKRKAIWNKADIDAYETAGLHQFAMGEKRRAINAAGIAVVEAERRRRQGNTQAAAETLSEAIENLEQLQSLVGMLLKQTPRIWRVSRYADDPAIDDIHMRRLRLSRDALRRQLRRLEKARTDLRNGHDCDLSKIIGGDRAIFIAANNPSPSLVEILRPHIQASNDGRNWQELWHRGYFMLPRMRYAAAIVPGPRLPKHLRLTVVRSHLNPSVQPPHERLKFDVVRTLSPGEILDNVPADYDVHDHRLIRVPALTYKLVQAKDWSLQFDLTEVEKNAALPFVGR